MIKTFVKKLEKEYGSYDRKGITILYAKDTNEINFPEHYRVIVILNISNKVIANFTASLKDGLAYDFNYSGALSECSILGNAIEKVLKEMFDKKGK